MMPNRHRVGRAINSSTGAPLARGTHSNGRDGKCKRGCCWTPLDVCAKHGNCKCHVHVPAMDILAIAEEQARLEKTRVRDKETTWTRH